MFCFHFKQENVSNKSELTMLVSKKFFSKEAATVFFFSHSEDSD